MHCNYFLTRECAKTASVLVPVRSPSGCKLPALLGCWLLPGGFSSCSHLAFISVVSTASCPWALSTSFGYGQYVLLFPLLYSFSTVECAALFTLIIARFQSSCSPSLFLLPVLTESSSVIPSPPCHQRFRERAKKRKEPKCYLVDRLDPSKAFPVPTYVLEDGMEYTFMLPSGLFLFAISITPRGRGDSGLPQPCLVGLRTFIVQFFGSWDWGIFNGSDCTLKTDLGGTVDDMCLLLEKKHS